jgi:hypothetical protein
MYRVYQAIRAIDTVGAVEYAISTVNGDVTLDTTYHTVLVDASGGAVTVTLPSAVDFDKVIYNIKKVDSSTNVVTIAGTIDGDTNFDLLSKDEIVTVQSNGSGWYIAG